MTSLPYAFRLTEEIARWAFELHARKFSDWHLVFTNPTAGPWKRLLARDAEGIEGEVHRFEREEDRPDLVLLNDDLDVLLIIEAKDGLDALVASAQVERSCGVVKTLSETLRLEHANQYWEARSEYSVLPGLLWGSTRPTGAAAVESTFRTYREGLGRLRFVHRGVVGFEVSRSGDELTIYGHAVDDDDDDLAAGVLRSLDL